MLKNIIYLTYRNRKKIAEMCVSLLPRVGYARVTRSGIVILKKSKWSLFRKRIPVTDIIIKYIPIEVGKLICKKADRAVYVSLFNDKVATIVSLTRYCDRMDLLDVVYKEYMKACIIVEPESVDIVADYKEPVIARYQSFKVDKTLNGMKHATNSHRLSDKVKKLKSKLVDLQRVVPIISLRIKTE